MADPIKPVAPPAPAPAAPAAPAPAAPAPSAVKAAITKPAPAAKPSVRPPPSARPLPKALSAKKALGLEETPAASAKKEFEKIRAAQPTKPTEYVAPVEAPEPPESILAPEPPAPAAPAAPAAPVAPAKIKVGDKEYTPEELEAALKPPAAPAAAPAAKPAAAPAPKPPTAEEIKAREDDFLASTAAAFDVPLTEAEMDTLLAGGKDAVAGMQTLLKRIGANAVLQSRKGVAAGLNPVMEQLFAAVQPLVAEHQNLQRYTIEQQFVAKHADFAPHLNTSRSVAEELVRLYPKEVAAMQPDQFIDEVARQTDIILTNEHRRWFPQGNGNWRQAPAAPAAPPAPAPAAPPAPAPAEIAPGIPAQPAAVAPAAPLRARPPAVNAPAGAGTQGAKSFAKSVAGSMRG